MDACSIAPSTPQVHHQHDPEDDETFRQMCQSLLWNDAVGVGAPDTAGDPYPLSKSTSTSGTSWALPPSTQPAIVIKEDNSPLQSTPSPAAPRKMSKKLEEAASAKWSRRQITLKIVEAERLLQRLAEQQGMAEAENARLKSLTKNLSACVEYADFQQRMSSIVRQAPRSPLPLPPSCSQVSFSELPHSSCWDAAWLSRIKSLKPQDFLVLRRQWIQQSAVLLPQALMYGPGSGAHEALEGLYNRHVDLLQAMATLAPHVWLASSQYDMETLMPITAPTTQWVRDLFQRVFPPEVIARMCKMGQQYHSSTSCLSAEYQRLLLRYDVLSHGLGLQDLGAGDVAGGAGSRSASASASHQGLGACRSPRPALNWLRLDQSPRYVDQLQQLDDTAELLEANAGKQRTEFIKLFSGFYHGFYPARLSFVLMLYPLASTAFDFIPGILLLDGASSDSPPTAQKV